MNYRLFLLLCCTVLGDISAEDPLDSRQKVHAYVGLPVILPCQQMIPKNAEVPTVEWSKPGLKPQPYVFVLRQNYEMHQEKHKDFEFRAGLFMSEVDQGNFDMRLSDVRKEDEGTFICKTIWDRDRHDLKTVELVVDDLPTPELSVVSVESEAVTLSCLVRTCSPSRPRLAFLDELGNRLKDQKDQITDQDKRGCYELVQQVTATSEAKSVACRAEFSDIGHSQDARIVIPECNKEPCTLPMIYVGIGGLFLLILVGLAFLIHKLSRKSDKKKTMVCQSSFETTTSSGSERNPFLLQQSSPEPQNEEPTVVTEMIPDLLSSTPTSTVSKAETRLSSAVDISGIFPDTNTATCEVSPSSKCVKFKANTEENRKLIRQDASCDHDPFMIKSLSKSVSSLSSGFCKSQIVKSPVRRTRSASDSGSVNVSIDAKQDLKKSPSRRLSLTRAKFEKLEEETELERQE